jgi:RNA polymerase sigma-70 factor, ECF subfamily
MISDTVEAEDAAQEIFFKAYQALHRFRGDASFSTWLYRIAVNYCRDLLRKKSRRKTESWDALLEKEGDRLQKILSDPPGTLPAGENADLVRRVLSRLSPEHRMVLVLREIEGLSYQEMSETLDCSLDAVKGRLRRAREEFEKRLRHFWSVPSV